MSNVEHSTPDDFAEWEEVKDYLGGTHFRPANMMPIPAGANVVHADDFPRRTEISSAGTWGAEHFAEAESTHFLRYEPSNV